MRRHDIISGILFILSIIDFALAAPVLPVQEKHQASVDAVVHIPKDVKTVWRKRGKELDDLLHPSRQTWEKYFDSLEHELDNAEPSASDSSSSSGQSGPNAVQRPGSVWGSGPSGFNPWRMDAVQRPGSGSGPGPSDPNPWRTNAVQRPGSGSGSGPSEPNPWWTTNAVQRPPARPSSEPDLSRTNPNRLNDQLLSYKGNGDDEPPPGEQLHTGHTGTPTPSAYASSGYASDEDFAKTYAPSPNHNPMADSDSDLGPGPDYDLDHWMNSESEDRVDHGPPSTTGAARAETNVVAE